MMFSGIVLRTRSEDEVGRLRARLAEEPRCTAGASAEGSLAAVLEFRDTREARGLHEWLLSLPEVRGLDVAGIQYEYGDRADEQLQEAT